MGLNEDKRIFIECKNHFYIHCDNDNIGFSQAWGIEELAKILIISSAPQCEWSLPHAILKLINKFCGTIKWKQFHNEAQEGYASVCVCVCVHVSG